MRLKRLEIIGFKSFLEKTIVSFDKDVTAIVGPNGCGKSNIVDAICWVMGEQSAKHLRGKSMEDVIFAGSEVRAQLSMASVELTFSTEGYQTPFQYADQSEISVCRRLYRTGESEYFINRIPVRLKDITDLFLGTGVGRKAYSVIEQGKVHQIVTAKPEQRRYYIEEVAGVSKFKARKEAAERKIEATQQNLLRLTDIVTEVERQIRTLDRQARKAEKYREVKNEFTTLDLKLLSTKYQHFYEAQDQLEKDLKELDGNEVSRKTSLLEQENKVEIYRTELIELEKNYQSVQNNHYEITNAVKLGEAAFSYKKEELEGLVKNREVLDCDIEEVEKELTGMNNGLDQLGEQKMLVDFEEASLIDEVEVLQKEVDEKNTSIANLRTCVDQIRELLFTTEARLQKLETLLGEKDRRGSEIRNRLEKEEIELEELKKQYNQFDCIYRESNQALDSLKQLKLDLHVRTDSLFSEVASLKEILKSKQDALLSLKEELALKKSRLVSLEELQRNFEGYEEGTRQVMLQKEKMNQEGIFGTVAQFVETEPRYEGAISAILGEKLQYVVVKSQQEGLEAVQYLQSVSAGRTSFVPLQLRNYASDHGDIPTQQGVLGPMKQFVRFKNDYDHLADFLFGDVVLVEDLKKAVDLWASNGHRKTLVTLGGEVVDPTGVITGGSPAKTSQALLEKKREMKELAQMISLLEDELKEKEKGFTDLASKLENLESHLEQTKTNSVEEEIKVSNQEKDIVHLKKDLEALEKKQTELTMAIDLDRKAWDILLPEMATYQAEQKELVVKSNENKKIHEEKRFQLEEHQKLIESRVAALTKKKIELAQAKERNIHLENEVNRIIEEKNRLRLMIADLETKREIADGRVEFLKSEIYHTNRTIQKKLKQRASIEEDVVVQRENYESRSSAIRDLELTLRQLRQDHDEASSKLNQVSISLTETRGEMKILTEQCLERHQILLADIYQNHLDETLILNEVEERVKVLRDQLSRMGEVNTGALTEYEEQKTRFDFLSKQKEDLENSLTELQRVIQKINRTTKEKFLEAFRMVDEKFQVIFPHLFKGGKAKLLLINENDLLESGVDIIAQPPGKKLQSISLLSGGEKALTAVSLIFAMFLIKPSPFCILDEVDAPLDDVNVGRYNDIIREMTGKTQFVVITHNKNTMETADVLYGVTMQEAGVSQLVSVEMH